MIGAVVRTNIYRGDRIGWFDSLCSIPFFQQTGMSQYGKFVTFSMSWKMDYFDHFI